MSPYQVIIEAWLDDHGAGPFGSWFTDLDARAAAKVTVALSRIERRPPSPM